MRWWWGWVRREAVPERARETLSRIERQEPRVARSWREARSGARSFRDPKAFVSGSVVVARVGLPSAGWDSVMVDRWSVARRYPEI